MSYQTPKENAHASIEIKKSIFKAFSYPILDKASLKTHLDELKASHPDARHHCWAYIIGDPENTTSAGFDDDGEPSGTAGKPILNVLQHKKIGNCAIIVVRYFGGIKLGAGGLTRAYSQSAQSVVDNMSLIPHIPTVNIHIITDFATEAQCRHLIGLVKGNILEVNYSADVQIILSMPQANVSQLNNLIGGQNIKITPR